MGTVFEFKIARPRELVSTRTVLPSCRTYRKVSCRVRRKLKPNFRKSLKSDRTMMLGLDKVLRMATPDR